VKNISLDNGVIYAVIVSFIISFFQFIIISLLKKSNIELFDFLQLFSERLHILLAWSLIAATFVLLCASLIMYPILTILNRYGLFNKITVITLGGLIGLIIGMLFKGDHGDSYFRIIYVCISYGVICSMAFMIGCRK